VHLENLMFRGLIVVAVIAAFAGIAPAALAQGFAPKKVEQPRREPPKPKVPDGYRPPPGLCRIWLDNVPPAQQPAPTDCANAIRNKPPNGQVIFSDDDDKNADNRSRDRRPDPKAKKPDRPGER
jgi:hypothetical protein